ncbi:DUF2267 domain-containing protein [Cytophagaceae bacterium ABcell3]|nr:DUF2267 domain-containing protein [Cytophagaceae bacterium ABcell3]
MEYNQLLESVKSLEFVQNDELADAAIKATLGKVVSSMDEDGAKKFTSSLSEPLSYERLRSHQASTTNLRGQELILEIAAQFNLDQSDAERLVMCIFRNAKEQFPDESKRAMEEKLNPELLGLVQQS